MIWLRAVQNQIVGEDDFATYINAMIVPPSQGWLDAASQLFTDLKLALGVTNLSEALDIAYILAAETAQAGLLNMVNPGTNDATNVNNMAFEASRGFTGNGTSSYLNTTFIPVGGINYTSNNASMGIYSRTNIDNSNYYDMGARNASANETVQIHTRGSGFTLGGINGGQNLFVATPGSLGLYVVNRSANSAHQLYKNGASIVTSAVNSTTRPGASIFIGAYNQNGTPGLYTTRQYAFGFAGRSMNATEQANFYTAVQTFMTAIGAAV